jgi:hypothetical protein
MNLKYVFVLFIILIATNCPGQSISRQIIGSAGSNMSNSDVNISWTVGEPVTKTFSNNDYILLQGFHVGPISAQIADYVYENFSGLNISLYPNPVEDQLVIEFDELCEKPVVLQLFSITGEMMLSMKIPAFSLRERLSLSDYNSGTYFLKIIYNKREEVYTLIKK